MQSRLSDCADVWASLFISILNKSENATLQLSLLY